MNALLSNGRVSEAVRSNGILSKLRATSQEKLIAGATFQELEKGATVCHQETPAVRFWLVLNGEIKLVKYTTKGVALLIDIVLPGQLFGTVLYSGNPLLPWSGVAMGRVELLSFRLKDLLGDLEENAPLQQILLEDTCYKLCQSQGMRVLCLEEARVRVAYLLLYLYEKFGLVIPQTRATLAELAGMSVETATRITTMLVRRGILASRRGQIEILSLRALQSYAQAGGPDV